MATDTIVNITIQDGYVTKETVSSETIDQQSFLDSLIRQYKDLQIEAQMSLNRFQQLNAKLEEVGIQIDNLKSQINV